MSIKQSVHCIQHLIHVTIFKSLVIKGKPSPTQGAEDFRLLADEGLTHPIEKKCPKALEGLGALIIFLVKDGRDRTYFTLSSRRSGNFGMAPGWVQTKALTSTASLWASFTGIPARMAAANDPVKLSPAPTVSTTSTMGVG